MLYTLYFILYTLYFILYVFVLCIMIYILPLNLNYSAYYKARLVYAALRQFLLQWKGCIKTYSFYYCKSIIDSISVQS